MAKKKKVFISGKISGRPRAEYLAEFRAAEERLRAMGYRVSNPTRTLVCRWPLLYRLLGYNLTLLLDLWLLMRCDFIYKLPGWKRSRGANIESCVAYHFKIWTFRENNN